MTSKRNMDINVNLTLTTGQGQQRVTIGGPESSMLHTKFQDHQPFSPEKRIFKEFYQI